MKTQLLYPLRKVIGIYKMNKFGPATRILECGHLKETMSEKRVRCKLCYIKDQENE